MNTLTPSQAATIAEGVYRLRAKDVAELQRTGERLGCEGLFSSGATRFTGAAGSVFKSISGFGYMSEGEGTMKGEVLCATRGTATMYDWASNLNIGVQTGPGGHFVHAGFNEIWKTSAAGIREFLQNKNPTHIHVVGHSLGGALAMLNADFFSVNKVAAVSLYTFGAPRTGLDWFASSMTTRLGADRIFRVSHIADPVPMIPIFPFSHIPTSTPGYVIGIGGGSSVVSVSAHGMLGSYIPRVSDKTWAALRTESTPVTDKEVQQWMATSSEGGGVLMHSAEALRMIGRVLKWLLAKAGTMAMNTVGVGLTVGATLIDQIAWMIAKGAQLSQEVGIYTIALMRAIFKFLGHAAGTAYELTTRFLRWVLELLFATLGNLGSRALALAR